PKRRADSITSEQATPKRAKLRAGNATITFKQLRDYVDDLKQQGGKPSGQLQCPVCVLKQRGFAHFVRHLYEHLPTKEHSFYKCPFGECDYRTQRLSDVKGHVSSRAYNATWTDDM
ncbi:hypothetical protein AAVH_40793, partial [Aphelenchoides avenae]